MLPLTKAPALFLTGTCNVTVHRIGLTIGLRTRCLEATTGE